MFAPGFPYDESHRHFSHQMAYHPLGLIDFSRGEKDQEIIQNTLRNLEKQGSDYWTGYSFSWLGNLYARAFKGEKAAEVLRTFAECFCLKNSFHVNGDQCKAGHSKFTYRPFTLEGNFAYAAAVQEMLLQSHTGIVKLFPAIPRNWENCSFENLRTYGAFIVSAEKENKTVKEVTIHSEKGGELNLENPFDANDFVSNKEHVIENNVIKINLKKGETVKLQLK
jgi:alpha-L-fucosidase 2